MLKGIVLAVLDDNGPAVWLNLTELDEVESMKLAVSGMTAFGMGNMIDRTRNKLHGTFPIPYVDEDAPEDSSLVFPFSVSGETSLDSRIRKYGRECMIFLIYDKKRNDIKLILEIERKGQLLKIVPEQRPGKMANLVRHHCLTEDPESIVHIDWSGEWHDDLS